MVYLKKVIFLPLLIIFAIPLYAMREVYISASSGEDTNDGSQTAPLKTIAAAPKADANIFLKRGDVFFGRIADFENCKIAAYGDGEKPVVSGLKIVKNPDAWKRMANDVWKIDLENDADFDGYTDRTEKRINNIGAVYDIANDKVYGHLVPRYNALNNYGDFFVTKSIGLDAQDKLQTFRYLMLRSKKNPSADGARIAFSTYGSGIKNMKNCEVRDIALKGFAVHGVCKTWNCKFVGLDLDLIGGGIQIGYKSWVRFGNGFEFWVNEKSPCSNNIVEDCKVSRTYDCGATIQGISNGDIKIENVKFKNNVFIKCRQAFEHFVRSNKGKVRFFGCEFSNNKCFDCGDNEFSTPECRDACLLSYQRVPVESGNILIKDNVSWGASVYSLQGTPAKMQNNTFYVYEDQYLVNNRNKTEDTVFASDDNAVEKMRALIGNSSDKIVIVKRSDTSMRRRVIDEVFAPQKGEIKARTQEKYRRNFFYRK